MNKEKIEELAFKDRKELANLNELDLLEIIEFLQLDRKQWINQYSAAHNDYVDLQQENKKLKEELKYTVPIVEHNKIVSKKLKENQKYKEVIDKAIEIIKEYKECNWSKYDENEIEIELIDKILEILEDKEVE